MGKRNQARSHYGNTTTGAHSTPNVGAMIYKDRDDRLPVTGNHVVVLNRKHFFTISFFLIFVLLLIQLALILRPFFSPLAWAVVLATATYPLYSRLWQTIGRRQNVAAILMTVAVLFIAVLPAVYGTVLAGKQGLEAYNQAAAWFKAGHLQDVVAVWENFLGFGTISQELIGQAIVAGGDTIQTSLLEGGKVISSFILSQSVDLVANALMLTTSFFVMLFTLFFMFRDGESAYRSLFRAIPLEEDHKTKIFERLKVTLQAVIRGTVLTALVQGVVSGIIYFLLGLPFATFLGVLSGILSFLPVGGTALVWAPLALYLLLSGSVIKGLILLGAGIGLVGMMDNLLQPILVGQEARLPVLPLFFASFGGLTYFGFLGLFLGPILLAVVLEAFAIYQEEYQHSTSELILTDELSSTSVLRQPVAGGDSAA